MPRSNGRLDSFLTVKKSFIEEVMKGSWLSVSPFVHPHPLDVAVNQEDVGAAVVVPTWNSPIGKALTPWV